MPLGLGEAFWGLGRGGDAQRAREFCGVGLAGAAGSRTSGRGGGGAGRGPAVPGDMISMKLEYAELKHVERIVAVSKAAFESDIHVGASEAGGPPGYDSVPWHIQMNNEGHLLQAVMDGEIVGGAILFVDKDGETLNVGRIFLDPVHHRKGHGLSLMKMVETFHPGIKKIKLDTPLWNARTNAFYAKLGYREVKRDEGFVYYQKALD